MIENWVASSESWRTTDLKNFPHVFYGGKALNGFPVRWTLGLSNPREMIRLLQCQRKENEQLLASLLLSTVTLMTLYF
ncbi:hypothetical protein TNCV_1561631 [Trichonephila clavipes]|nr:hypothetical protein TNCV_1561631 [Trichonephila clavipes]